MLSNQEDKICLHCYSLSLWLDVVNIFLEVMMGFLKPAEDVQYLHLLSDSFTTSYSYLLGRWLLKSNLCRFAYEADSLKTLAGLMPGASRGSWMA